jgi:hypothetical protein
MIIGEAREGTGCLHLDGLETGTRSLIDLDAGRTSIFRLRGAQERIQYLLAKFSRPA